MASVCGMATSFRALEAARSVADEVNSLLRDRRRTLIHRRQLRDSVQSIAANIKEGTGRAAGPDRKHFYRIGRGSAEEADEHLRANRADGRLPADVYWRLHHRLMVVIKMLNILTID